MALGAGKGTRQLIVREAAGAVRGGGAARAAVLSDGGSSLVHPAATTGCWSARDCVVG